MEKNKKSEVVLGFIFSLFFSSPLSRVDPSHSFAHTYSGLKEKQILNSDVLCP